MAKLKIGEINKALRQVQKDLMVGAIPAEAFNMATPSSTRCKTDTSFCGTAACIGGHAAMNLGVDPTTFVTETEKGYDKIFRKESRELLTTKIAEKLNPLFYPYNEDMDWTKLTPAQGVLAIENYFNGKSNPWKGVIV